MVVNRRSVLGWWALLLVVSGVNYTLVNSDDYKQRQPYSFGFSWDRPIDTSQLKQTKNNVYVTNVPPAPVQPYQRFMLVLDDRGLMGSLIVTTNFVSNRHCNNARRSDVSLWFSRYKHLNKSSVKRINENVTKLHIPGFTGTTRCVHMKVDDRETHKYILSYEREQDRG